MSFVSLFEGNKHTKLLSKTCGRKSLPSFIWNGGFFSPLRSLSFFSFVFSFFFPLTRSSSQNQTGKRKAMYHYLQVQILLTKSVCPYMITRLALTHKLGT
eukprot:TRINITY_DN4957_c0_g1_i1.p1 TRINITY_DN4957_c0_g1~~TRINITY_DN4957_c0_g1_i1.p1  ORF type:complete len:100 (+),score=0.09 TRINITY_DN4957_c0_g1_i1:854-1153(+)